jgi:hypothetical protein
MIKAVVKIQGCTTRPGRRAFVGKQFTHHGIANGVVRFYEVTAPDWSGVRQAVASYDTSGSRTMGFSGVSADTVEFYLVQVGGSLTATHIRPLPLGTTSENAPRAVSWWPNAQSANAENPQPTAAR